MTIPIPAFTPASTVPFIPRPRVPTPWSRVPSVVRALYLLAQPHGGQRSARQNAWASMSENAAHGRSRAEAADAMAAAQLRPPVRGSQATGSQDGGPVVRTGLVSLEITG